MFLRSLCVHVDPYRLKRCAAHAANEIRPVPEQRLVVERCKMFCKAAFQPSNKPVLM